MRIAQIPPQKKTIRNVGPRYCSVCSIGENILSRYSDNKVIVITGDPMLTSPAFLPVCTGGGGGGGGDWRISRTKAKPNYLYHLCNVS